jgi:hypothetical protein
MVNSTDVGVTHEGDNVMSSKDRVKQIKEERKKNSWYGKVGKFIFYFVVLIFLFFIIRKTLRTLKIIQVGEDNVNGQDSSVELKTNGIKSE